MSFAFALTACLTVYNRAPITSGEWSKQTVYLWLLDSWHGQDKYAKARLLLIDDDCGDGICQLKRICDETGFKAAFAVIPSRLSTENCDSLLRWQQDGYSVCLHGYNHDDWEKWSVQDITHDIERSEKMLRQKGIKEPYRYVVTPYGRNNHAIREAISAKGYQMITGARLVNPDTTVFQLGRVFVDKDTDMKSMEELLRKAKRHNSFVILGTHSSNPDEFSPEKTKSILKMAKQMNF